VFVYGDTFSNFITTMVFVASILVGVEAEYPNVAMITYLQTLIVWIFAGEFGAKLVAEGFAPQKYFKDNWNNFGPLACTAHRPAPFSNPPRFSSSDAAIAITGVMGLFVSGGPAIIVVKMLRLLRAVKLTKAIPKMRVLVETIIAGISSVGYVGILFMLFNFLFSILGMMLYKESDPYYFGTLGGSLITLYVATTTLLAISYYYYYYYYYHYYYYYYHCIRLTLPLPSFSPGTKSSPSMRGTSFSSSRSTGASGPAWRTTTGARRWGAPRTRTRRTRGGGWA